MKLLWQQIPSTIVTEIYINTEFDGVVLDTEHSPFNNETLYSCIQVAKLSGKKCFVRLAHLDKIVTKMCMDAGCDGIIFSTVEDEVEAQTMVDYCRYPHQGGNRGQGLVRENKWGEAALGDKQVLVIAQIETKKAVDNLEKIKQCNFDMYLIGPYDLSASLGCVEKFYNSEYLRYTDKIMNAIPKHQLGIHIPKDVAEHYPKNRDYGFVALGMDTTMIIQNCKELYSV